MARKLRIEYAGAVYQIMNRGDRQEPTFEDDPDCEGIETRQLRHLPQRGVSRVGSNLQASATV